MQNALRRAQILVWVPGIFPLPREEALIKLILKVERLRPQLLKELETV